MSGSQLTIFDISPEPELPPAVEPPSTPVNPNAVLWWETVIRVERRYIERFFWAVQDGRMPRHIGRALIEDCQRKVEAAQAKLSGGVHDW